MSEEGSNHAETRILNISPFRDPVDNPQIAATNYNPLYGYYGYVRDNGITPHSGFDYKAASGTDVFPVCEGVIWYVRFGRNEAHNQPSYLPLIESNRDGMTITKTKKRDGTFINKIKTVDDNEILITISNDGGKKVEVDGEQRSVIKDKKGVEYVEYNKKFKCPLMNSISNKHYDHEVCSRCKEYLISRDKNNKYNAKRISARCYGVQVWLKIEYGDNDRYAFYAHLSELNENIANELIKQYDKHQDANTFKIKYAIESNMLGEPIGKSGRTGNAWNETPHLHFECRKGLDGKRIIPNHIVKTHFMAWERIDDDIMISMGDPLDEISQEEWYVFFDVKKIIDRIAERKKQKEERQKNNNSTKEIDDEIAQLEDALKKRWRKRREQIFIAEY